MHPYFFGAGARRLFGVYEPAVSGSERPQAAVLCHPWGPEYLHAYRTMRLLAKRLTAHQFHTLRFDYVGTGDSAGESEEGGLDEWEADIESALDEIADTVGTRQPVLIGMRLGASLALKVAMKRPHGVSALVLWDPIFSGRQYLEELHSSSRPDRGSIDGAAIAKSAKHVDGFPLTERLETGLRALDLFSMINDLSVRTLIMMTRGPKEEPLSRRMPAVAGRAVSIEDIASIRPWVESPVGQFPVDAVQRVASWLDE